MKVVTHAQSDKLKSEITQPNKKEAEPRANGMIQLPDVRKFDSHFYGVLDEVGVSHERCALIISQKVIVFLVCTTARRHLY